MEEIGHALTQANLFISIGTSGVVYPAAGFAGLAVRHGIRTIEINPVTTDISPHFNEHLRGPATEKVPAWVDGILSAAG
jgi:NAD-dependent deacetylase